VFLAPALEAAQARAVAPAGMTVVAAGTLTDALRWLCTLPSTGEAQRLHHQLRYLGLVRRQIGRVLGQPVGCEGSGLR
jgi:hypothetical protein